jgi:hypothetical protein
VKGTHDFVYVIAMDAEHHKIGISGRPESRLAQLQTSHPRPLRLIFVLKTNRALKVEGSAHHILAKRRLLGEWFAADAEGAINAVLKADRKFPPWPPGRPRNWREAKWEAAVAEFDAWEAAKIAALGERYSGPADLWGQQ